MIRKSLLVAAIAAASLSAAALAPSTASAKGFGGFHGFHGGYHGFHHFGPRFGFGPVLIAGGECYLAKTWVETPFGPRRRLTRVCD